MTLDAVSRDLLRRACRGAAASRRLVREAEELVVDAGFSPCPPATVHSPRSRTARGRLGRRSASPASG